MPKIFSEKQTLYIHRLLLNPKPFISWFKEQGFKYVVDESVLHVTIAFSREKVLWSELPKTKERKIKVPDIGERKVEALGDEGAVVLKFQSGQLQDRWKQLIDAGCSWDYESYQPHVTITYDAKKIDLNTVEPYTGELIFGPEIWDKLNLNFKADKS